MPKSIERATQSWEEASKDLGFKVVFDMEVFFGGEIYRWFAFIPEFGSKTGIFLGLYEKGVDALSSELAMWCDSKNQRCTFINPASYGEYRRQFFIDTLLDWGFFGETLPPWTDKRYVPWG
jgi:hypothetical protein